MLSNSVLLIKCTLVYNLPMFTWFSLTLLSVLFLIAYYFLSKKIFNEQAEVDPRFFGASLQFCVGLIALPLALATGFHFELTTTSIVLLFLMGLCYTVGPSLYYLGLKNVELSESMILGSSGILWSLVLGLIVLEESLTCYKIAGVVLVFSSIILITYTPNTKLKSYSKYKIMLLISSFFYVLAATFDNKLIEFSNAASYMSVSFLLGGTFMLIANLPRLKSAGIATYRNKMFWKVIAVNAIFIYLTYICVMRAYELGGEVSRMYPIQQSESILVPLLGIFLLKERKRIPVKILAAIIAFSGIILIKF
jgi:drug/metabolite transporter (DMT)-like permease